MKRFCTSKGATRGEGAEAPLLSQVKVEKKDKNLIFSQFCANNPIKMLLQHLSCTSSYLILLNSSSWRSYFCKNIGYFEFFEWFGHFVVLQINNDVIKLQEYELWRHFGDVIKLRHLNYIIKMTLQKFFIFKPPLAKSWLRPCEHRFWS